MKKSLVLSAAVMGLLVGASLTGCSSAEKNGEGDKKAADDKASCKSADGKASCKSADGKASCKTADGSAK